MELPMETISAVIVLFLSTCICRLVSEGTNDRLKRDSNLSWKYTQYQISYIKRDMANYDLRFCQGDAFRGIQCPEERICASWDQVCDGKQLCALRQRQECLNQTKMSYGKVDERLCSGDEESRWCNWKFMAPQRCGKDYVINSKKARKKKIKITSPDYPRPYPTDRFCFWTVTAPEGHTLSVRFRKFVTEKNYDYVSVGNGLRYGDERSVILFRHSGAKRPKPKKFNSRSNQIWITFRSDDWDGQAGFVIEVQDTMKYDAGLVGRNPFNGKPDKNCGGKITLQPNEEYRLTSPGYPKPYKNFMQCTWVVSLPKGRRIKFEFETFELEEEEDYISIGNGDDSRLHPIIYKASGRNKPDAVITADNAMWVKFYSSLAISRAGFSILIRDAPYASCGTEQVNIIPVLDGSSVSVASPNYPEHYPNNVNCVIRFQSDVNHRLFIQFREFGTERYYDHLSYGVGLGPNETTAVVWRHYGLDLPSPSEYLSSSSVLWIQFTSDVSTTDKGFVVDVYDETGLPDRK